MASRLDRALSRPFRHGEDELFITASVGVALSTPGRRGVREMVSDADAAMLRAKRLGKHRFEIFDEAMRERMVSLTMGRCAKPRPPRAPDIAGTAVGAAPRGLQGDRRVFLVEQQPAQQHVRLAIAGMRRERPSRLRSLVAAS